MKSFVHVSAKSIKEAGELLETYGGKARLNAGGTDLLVRRRAGLIKPESLVCLERVEELQEISQALF